MSFSVNSNLSAQQAYNALAKMQSTQQNAQLQLATTKKINSVADDTSGYTIGKQLEAQTNKMKSQLQNVSSAQNFLSTAESALSQIQDKMNAIVSKGVDSTDPMKSQTSIASDIRTLAGEISSILSSTNINGTQVLASTDGSTALGQSTFNVGGATFNADFGGSSYLNTSAIATAVGTANLQSTDAATVISAASTTNMAAISADVTAALDRIGNLQQSLTSRSDFLTAAISNNSASLSSIFDSDVAQQQLNSSKGQVASQIGTAMLSQLNQSPSQIMRLFQ